MAKQPEIDKAGTLKAINEILETNYTRLDQVPTDKLTRVYLLLKIEDILIDHPEFTIFMEDYNKREDAVREI